MCLSAGGQHDGGGLPQEPRRDQVQVSVGVNEEDPPVSEQSSDYDRSQSHITGQLNVLADLASRVESSSSVGMDPELRGVQLGDRSVALGTSRGRFVRKRQQSQTRDVDFTLPGRKDDRRRRPSLPVAEQGSYTPTLQSAFYQTYSTECNQNPSSGFS